MLPLRATYAHVPNGYGGVNLEIAKDIVERCLADLLTFVTVIRARLQ